MTAAFPFDDARRLAASALRRYRDHRDFDDLVSETVLASWRGRQRHPDMALGLLVTTSARFMVKKWFSDGRCGDIVGRRGKGRVPVFTMRWETDGEEQMEAETYDDQIVPDFADALIEQIISPPDPEEGEIRLTYHERRQREEAMRRTRVNELFARCREEERRYGQELLALPDLMEHHREAIRLRYIEGLSMRQAAAAVGLHWTSVTTAAKRARRRLETRR